MNLVLCSVVALLGLQAAVASDAASGSPVERIVKLLSELKDKSVNDGKHEQQIYDKYACWCETTSTRKANDIDQARADMRSLGQRILKLKGKVATRAAEIAELSEDIENNENEQESITSVRQKQNGAWAAESAEVKQALGALQEAIGVLAAATTPKGAAALVQENLEVRAKYAVNNVLDKLPSKIGLPPARMALLSEFTTAAQGYAPQSATIQGMLGDMYLTFAANLESDTNEEADRNNKYEKMYATLEDTNNQCKDTRDRKESEKAEAEAMLADTTKAYEDTEKQMEADIEFFGQTKKACLAKHAEMEERKKMRAEEVDGIEQALKILTSDEARANFADAIAPGVGFLQIASEDSNGVQIANRAYNLLKTQVKKTHSVRLAALAVQVRTATTGHFGAVTKAIDKMLNTLAEEGQADKDKKDQCKSEYQEIAKTVNDLDWKIKNNLATIAKKEKLIELRTQEKADTIQKIGETQDYIKKIKADRKQEHDDYINAKADDTLAHKTLLAAKTVFEKFFKKNVKAAAFFQEPEFARSEDAAPDATLSGKGNNAGKTKGILALFDYILEDITDELANAKKDEAEQQADFEDELNSAETLLKDLGEKKTGLEGIIAKRITDKKEENTDMKENNGDRDDELKYKGKITPDCDWILKAFDQRADARAAEQAGLTSAKEALASSTALLQESPRKFDDSKLPSMNFLGISQ